jgi:hypothetical protein
MNKRINFLKDKRGDLNMVNAGICIVVLLVVLYVGINIISNLPAAFGLESGDTLYQTQLGVVNPTKSDYSMDGIMPIVIIAVSFLGGLLLLYRLLLYLFAPQRD